MKFIAAVVFALFVIVQLGGCARQSATVSHSNLTGGQPIASGVKQPSQVAPCCKALAEGRISLDQCMENPTCKANNRVCCMQAIQ
jgi:hypothetical protein